jgi:hypothetical protein
MFFLMLLFATMFFYLLLGRPATPQDAPTSGAGPVWRCVLKNKQVIDMPAPDEATALKLLMKQKVRPETIRTLERV